MESILIRLLKFLGKAVFYGLVALLVFLVGYILWNLNYDVIFAQFGRLAGGTVMTIQLVAASVFIGFFVALPTALMRVSANPLFNIPAYGFIFFFRGTPLLVQMFFIYYGLAQLEFIRESFLWPVFKEAYWCALIAFTLNTGAYSAEILRGAIQAVPAGEIEAARAIGMSKVLAYRRIILPRAFRIGLPAYGNEIILMIKGSALASTITLLDLTGMARTIIARTYTPVEIFLAAGVIYILLTVIFVEIWKRIETRGNRYLGPDAGGQPSVFGNVYEILMQGRRFRFGPKP